MIRRTIAALALLLGVCGGAVQPAAAAVLPPLADAISYSAELAASPNGRTWSGTERITLRNAGSTPLDRVWLRLWGNGPQGCTPLAVTATVQDGGTARRLERNCTALEVVLPSPLAPSAVATITLALVISAPSIADRFGVTDGIALFGNALPLVAQRDRAAWRLPAYSPYGESWVTTWARFTLTLRHPATLAVAAAGTTSTAVDADGQTATTTSIVDARDSFWAIGTMQATTVRSARGVVVRAWSSPTRAGERVRAARDAAGALNQIEHHLPAYPYDEYDVIVAPIQAGGGMEYPTITITDGTAGVTRHETGHQWFYGVVGSDQFREPWVDEGFTTFLEAFWSSPRRQPRPHCYEARRFTVPRPSTFITSPMTYWNAHVGQYTLAYDNPACALQAARQQLGERRFTRIMRTLVTTYRERVVTGAQVRAAFGASVRPLWPQWGLAPRPSR